MSQMLAKADGSSLPERFRMQPKPAKATLDSPKSVRKLDEWKRDAEDCKLANRLSRLEPKELLDALGFTSSSQFSDQMAARERPQTERWRNSDKLRGPYLIAQAIRHPELFDVMTTITVRRTA